MNLEALLSEGLIRKIEPNKERAEMLLELAERDLKAANDNLEKSNFDWSYAIAYNAMLQATRAIMISNGFIPSGSTAHVAVVLFARAFFGKTIDEKLLSAFDRMRKRRHLVVYDEPLTVGKSMAEEAIKISKAYIGLIKDKFKEM